MFVVIANRLYDLGLRWMCILGIGDTKFIKEDKCRVISKVLGVIVCTCHMFCVLAKIQVAGGADFNKSSRWIQTCQVGCGYFGKFPTRRRLLHLEGVGM